jgi:PAS domain S-box-containing protein
MAPREMTVKRRDGTRFFVLVGAREIKDSKGNLLYYQAEHVDITERKRMEEALRESEERFRHLFDASPDGIVVIGPDGCITNVNNTQVQMFRYESLTDLIGVHATQLVAMSSRDYSAQILQRRLNGEDIPPVEYELVRKDGTTFYGVTSATILRREDGTVSGYLCTTRDTTERKRTEEELKRKQKMLARTESIAHIGSWEWDIATDTVTWSNELFQIFQRDPREVAPSFAEQTAFYHPDDMVRLQKAVEATLADGTPYTLELRVIRKDGETRVCVARGYPEIVRSGRPVRLFGSLQDITESKLTEKALKESENLYRSLFENMLNGFAYCQMIFKEGRSQDLLYLSVNKAFEKLTGLKNVAGRKITEVIPGIKESNPELLEIYGRVALTGKPESFEDYLEPLKAWLFISVYSPAKGYIIAVFDNITARKREEEEIRKSHEELRMLANHLQNIREEERNHLAREFHDQLGQSMTALKMDLSLLLRMISDEKQDIQRNLVAEELQSMQKLVDETSQLLWTIITELRPQMLDDLGLVATFEWEAQRFESRSGISCEFKSIAGDIQLDSKKSIVLFRIYQEALSNIIRHANATVVKSVLQRNGEMLVLEIKDNGRGISIDEQFKQKPFGLIGMRERALAIGGLLEISGIAGEGTTIIVRLPIGQVATEDSKGH